jgi:3'-phosphoadenosine 5'-phosphosulfate sulfotransferase (PAPS reductase)/FAD synthetase
VIEPVLDAYDRAVWTRLMIQARRHAKTNQHQRLVDAARKLTEQALEQSTRHAVMWSGGKDSTAMARLIVSVDPSVPLVSEKDDLDYPGEVDYVITLADQWGAQLTIIRPDISPSQWIAAHAHELTPGADMHSRAAGLSKACFYGVVEQATVDKDAVFLGLRAAESKHRNVARAVHGTRYKRKSGQWVCCPLADWQGIDVYAYLESHGIDSLHVYRCVGFMHAREPWRIRKSWWLPGASGRHGGITWLRRYYPSLYRQLLEWFPRAQSFS